MFYFYGLLKKHQVQFAGEAALARASLDLEGKCVLRVIVRVGLPAGNAILKCARLVMQGAST